MYYFGEEVLLRNPAVLVCLVELQVYGAHFCLCLSPCLSVFSALLLWCFFFCVYTLCLCLSQQSVVLFYAQRVGQIICPPDSTLHKHHQLINVTLNSHSTAILHEEIQ